MSYEEEVIKHHEDAFARLHMRIKQLLLREDNAWDRVDPQRHERYACQLPRVHDPLFLHEVLVLHNKEAGGTPICWVEGKCCQEWAERRSLEDGLVSRVLVEDSTIWSVQWPTGNGAEVAEVTFVTEETAAQAALQRVRQYLTTG